MENNCHCHYERLVKLAARIILIACASAFITEVALCFSRYVEGATTLNVVIKDISKVTFPEMTICPERAAGYKKDILEKYNLSAADIIRGNMGNITWSKFREATYNPEELIHFVEMETDKESRRFFNGSELFTKNIRSTYIRRYGRCATLNIPEEMIKKGSNAITIASKQSINVFVHPDGQAYGMNPKVFIDKGKSLFIDIIFVELNLIPDRGCIVYTDEKFDQCYARRFQGSMVESSDCILPYYGPVVEFMDHDLCTGNQSELFRKRNDFQHCEKPCNEMTINFGFPYTRDAFEANELGKATVFFKFGRSVQVKTMVYSYGAISMLAEIGGYSGLMLGFSVLDLSKFLLRFTRRKSIGH